MLVAAGVASLDIVQAVEVAKMARIDVGRVWQQATCTMPLVRQLT